MPAPRLELQLFKFSTPNAVFDSLQPACSQPLKKNTKASKSSFVCLKAPLLTKLKFACGNDNPTPQSRAIPLSSRPEPRSSSGLDESGMVFALVMVELSRILAQENRHFWFQHSYLCIVVHCHGNQSCIHTWMIRVCWCIGHFDDNLNEVSSRHCTHCSLRSVCMQW